MNTDVAAFVIYAKITEIVPITIPFDTEPDACGLWNVQCPIKTNDGNVLVVSTPVPEVLVVASNAITIHVELKGDNYDSLFCKEFPAKLVTSM